MSVPPNAAIPPLTVAGKSYKSVLRWDLRRDNRRYIFTILAAVVAAWLYFRSPLSAMLLRLSIIFVAVYVIWPFFRGTYLLRANGSAALHAGYKVVAPDAALEELWQVSIKRVEALGFRTAAYLEKEGDHPPVKFFCCILTHPTHGNMAQVAVAKSSLKTTHLLVFNTAFDDGLVLETANNQQPPLFRKKAKFLTVRLPRMRLAVDQYIVHSRLVDEQSRSRKPLKATADRIVAKFLADAEEIHSLNMNPRDYELNDRKERYRYTWKGAFRATFLRTWPVIVFRRNKVYAEADRVCARLGLQVDPKFGSLVGINRLEEIKRFSGNLHSE
jgi:hypothetical protein